MARSTLLVVAMAVTLVGLVTVTVISGAARRGLPQRPLHLASWLVVGVYLVLLAIRPALPWSLRNVVITLAAAAAATVIGAGLRTVPSVVTFLVTAAVMDLFSFSGGLTHKILEGYRTGTSDLLLWLSLCAPVGGRVIAVVGIGDLLIGGAAVHALSALDIGWGRAMGACAAGLVMALVIGVWRGGAPAIPSMAASCLALVWWQARKGPSSVW